MARLELRDFIVRERVEVPGLCLCKERRRNRIGVNTPHKVHCELEVVLLLSRLDRSNRADVGCHVEWDHQRNVGGVGCRRRIRRGHGRGFVLLVQELALRTDLVQEVLANWENRGREFFVVKRVEVWVSTFALQAAADWNTTCPLQDRDEHDEETDDGEKRGVVAHDRRRTGRT